MLHLVNIEDNIQTRQRVTDKCELVYYLAELMGILICWACIISSAQEALPLKMAEVGSSVLVSIYSVLTTVMNFTCSLV